MALTPEEIAEKEFTLGLRGYDKDEVRSYLQTVADDLREVIDAAAASVAGTATESTRATEVASAKARAATSDADGATAPSDDGRATTSAAPDWSNLGEEIASVLRTAHEQANGLRADAESQAAAIRDQAQQAADTAKGAAEHDRAEAAARLEQAQREALDLVAGAQTRIDERLAKAKETANREAEASVAELTEQIGQLMSTRDEVRAELTTLRSRLDDTIDATSGETVSAS